MDADVCGKCGQPLEEGYPFCLNCGSERGSAAPVWEPSFAEDEPTPAEPCLECQVCGRETPITFSFCGFCGDRLVGAAEAEEPTEPLSEGALIGSWRVVKPLGRGGLCGTFELSSLSEDGPRRAVAQVALTEVDDAWAGRFDELLERYAHLGHPRIVALLERTQLSDGRPCQIWELAPGVSLQQHLTEHEAIDIPLAIEIAEQVAEALGYLHAHGILHRDVKPGEVMLDGREARLQLSQISMLASRPDAPGAIAGTPPYMAPEQCVAGELTERTDLYGLGCLLYEMISGSPPFPPGNHAITTLFEKIVSEQPPLLLSPRGPVPPSLGALVSRMLAKDPLDRPQSCEEVLSQLRQLMPRTPVDLLILAGFEAVAAAGETTEGALRFRARDGEGEVTAYAFAQDSLVRPDLRTRYAAMTFLAETRLPCFVPVEQELTLGRGWTAFIRRDPVPPPIEEGTRWPAGPATVIAAVVLRGLALLRARGRGFENFAITKIRAASCGPEDFICLLQPPIEYERDDRITITMAGGELRGNPWFMSPGQLQGYAAPHDDTYAAGAVLHTLLAGEPPFSDVTTLFEMTQRKVTEAPPSIATLCPDLPREVVLLVDALVGRDDAGRSGPPAMIEEALLSLIEDDPPWRQAARRVLGDAPVVEMPSRPDELRRPVRPVEPSLSEGQQISDWTVVAHMAFGGEAEVYRVEQASSRTGVLKLWYDERIDPFSGEWREFQRSMHECAQRAGFPMVYEFGTYTRRTSRPYVILEEVDARPASWWRDSGVQLAAVQLLELGGALLESVAVAHEHLGVVGDLSAGNVLVREDLRPVLLDVAAPGLDRLAAKAYGTPGYVAPEVAGGQAPDAASDLFSAGVLLAELALGRRLFPEMVPTLLIPVGGFDQALATALEELGQLGELFGDLLAVDPTRRLDDASVAAGRFREAANTARVRAAAAARAGSSSILGLERGLPRPLARAVRTWRLEQKPQRRVLHGCGLGEVVARYLASVLIADYLSEPEGVIDPALEKAIAGMAARPLTFGAWIGIGRETARSIAGRRTPFVAELGELFGVRPSVGASALDELVALRNKIHVRPVASEGDLSPLQEQVDELVGTLLRELRFLSCYPLLHSVEQRMRRDGRFELGVLELSGTAEDPEQRTLIASSPLPADTVALCSGELSERLLLDPLLVRRPCARCGGAHTFLSSGGTRKGELRYSDYTTGHEIRELPLDGDGVRRPFAELLEKRGSLGLRGPLGVAPEECLKFFAGARPIQRGQLLGKWIVEEEIGRGAMGIVFRARHAELGKVAALKVVRPDLADEGQAAIRRLHREAQTIARLDAHPGIVQVLDVGTTEEEDACYLVMELLEGGDLGDRIRRDPRPELPEVLDLARQLVEAFAHTHRHGVIHRDLKPSNVLYGPDGAIKLVDFGVARDLTLRRSATIGFVGALAYAAPEQLSAGEVGPWTDHYALGLILFDLLRARPATTDGATRANLIRRWTKQAKPDKAPQELEPHASEERLAPLLKALAQLTHPDPDRREAGLESLTALS